MSELLRFANDPPRHVPVTEPGYYDGKDLYPFACPTCGGSGRAPNPEGLKPWVDTRDCPDCIDGRNPALEWARIETINRKGPANPQARWVAIGVAE